MRAAIRAVEQPLPRQACGWPKVTVPLRPPSSTGPGEHGQGQPRCLPRPARPQPSPASWPPRQPGLPIHAGKSSSPTSTATPPGTAPPAPHAPHMPPQRDRAGHAAAPRPGRSTGPDRAAPARVTITITEDAPLRHFAQERPAKIRRAPPGGEPADGRPRPATPPGDWELRPGKPGSWTLTLPGGTPLTVRLDTVPTHACDHRYQTSAYQPGDRLRRLDFQVRDRQCTFPTCSRPARDSDFEAPCNPV